VGKKEKGIKCLYTSGKKDFGRIGIRRRNNAVMFFYSAIEEQT